MFGFATELDKSVPLVPKVKAATLVTVPEPPPPPDAEITPPEIVMLVPAVITLPSAASICADVPPVLMKELPVMLPK